MSTDLWHPFADMSAVDRDGELVLTRGEGSRVWDEDGRSYLDATAGLWFANVGHGRREIADAMAAQAARIAAYSTFGDMANRPALDLATRVAALAPVPGSKVFFTSGGSDSVDTAVKLVRRYWALLGRPERRVVVVRDRAYHGMHLAGTALSGIDANRAGYGDLDLDVVRVPWDDAAALGRAGGRDRRRPRRRVLLRAGHRGRRRARSRSGLPGGRPRASARRAASCTCPTR